MILFLLSFICLSSLSSVSSDTTYCFNEDSCQDSTIKTTVADCYGYYACEGANVTSTYGYDFGAYANYDGECDDTYVYTYGLLSDYYSDVKGYAVFAYGYLSAYGAQIEPRSSTAYIYYYGLYSGYDSDVLCYSGDYCKVYCGASYGCADSSFYCYSGATCYYDCSNDTSYCPTLYSGVESSVEYFTGLSKEEESKKLKIYDSLSDDEITQHFLASRAIKDGRKGKENLEELISTLTQMTANDNKKGYAPTIKTETLGINSVSDHNSRVEHKEFEFEARKEWEIYQEEHKYERYGMAMAIDGVLLIIMFGLYNFYFAKKNNKINSDSTTRYSHLPLLTNETQA